MPYTPPSRSTASPPASPKAERRDAEPSHEVALPRSSSYLTRHRRTPSALGPEKRGNDSLNNDFTPPGTSVDLKSMAALDSIRQSPPPVTGPGGMPSGAVLSPPDSSSGSDDEEGLEMRGRKIKNLRELQDAVSHLSVHRESSPTNVKLATADLPEVVDLAEGMHHSFSTGALDTLGSRIDSTSVLSTEPNAIVGGSSLTTSEEDSDGEKQPKHPMVRKKSGELVRPALRTPSSRRRPASMPGTPTFSKAVHFDAHLEHVRHFLQLDRPLAVSAGSSPVENRDSDSEYPFPSSEEENRQERSPRSMWELQASNFPAEDVARMSLPVRIERFWLSKDFKSLQGSVAVANLAYHKNIVCRFTLDSWKTTSEVAATYTGQAHGSNHDRWTFTIRLSDMAHLETKTMYLCVRYNVNGQEYWDNNWGANFEVRFQKKYPTQNGKRGHAGAGSRPVSELPRSSTRRPNNDSAVRPKSTPACLIGDPFIARRTKLDSTRGYNDLNGPIRLKRHTPSSRSEDFTSGAASRSQAFGRRYDFNASLHEAKQSAKKGDSRQHTDVDINKSASLNPFFPPASGNDSPSRKDYTYDEIVNRFCFVSEFPPFSKKHAKPKGGNSAGICLVS